MSAKELFIRYLIMVPGIFILSFGIAFITKAGLGTVICAILTGNVIRIYKAIGNRIKPTKKVQ